MGYAGMTVKTILEAAARGDRTWSDTERLLDLVDWAGPRTLTPAQLSGVADTPPPDEDSPDWIQIVPGLTPAMRQAATRVYDTRPRARR